MKVLAVDTSTDVCSICITDSGITIAEYVTRSSLTHTERLLPAIDFLFSHMSWGIDKLNALAVIHGPGSFTGLRISLSVIKGLAFALQLPIASLNALEVAAFQVPFEGFISPAMDARRGEIFTCLFERRENVLIQKSEPKSISPERWKQELPIERINFCGPGAALYFDILRNHQDSRLIFHDFNLARTLAELAVQKIGKGEVISAQQLKATYLRPSDAEAKGPRPRKQLHRIPQR